MGAPKAHQTPQIAKDYVGRLLADDSSTEPQFALEIPVALPDAAGDVDIVLKSKFQLTEVLLRKVGGATGAFANTIQVKNLATAITEAVSINGAADNALLRATSVDDATDTVAAGGTLRFTTVKAGGNAQVLAIARGYMRK